MRKYSYCKESLQVTTEQFAAGANDSNVRRISHQSRHNQLFFSHTLFSLASELFVIFLFFQSLDTETMGKRKIGEFTYYSCDYTGLPMRSSNCYIPSYSKAGKFVKQGSYCCWEAVIAATENDANVKELVDEIVGCSIAAAPSQSALAWLSDTGAISTIGEFLAACDDPNKPVNVIEITVDGRCTEAVLARRVYLGFAHRFTTVRKKGKEKAYEVCYNGVGAPNAVATQYFKQELSGTVYIALKSKELAIQDRSRYLPIDIESFKSMFQTQRKRKIEALDVVQYEEAKVEMKNELMQFESASSASTKTPGDLAKASAMPSATGQEIANLVRMKEAELVPPPLCRQKSVRH